MSSAAILPHAPELMRHEAELKDLRWVAAQMVAMHDRHAAATGDLCQCPLCRHARPWVEKA